MPTDPTKHAAEMIRGLKGRIDKLEQASLSDRSGRSSDDLTVSPISKVVDRMNGSELITVSESTEPGSNVIDDFEDQDVSEYVGDTAAATLRTYPVQEGEYGLMMSSNSDGTATAITSTSGLPTYPTDGDTFRLWMYLGDSGVEARFYFGASDADNAYRVTLSEGVDELQLEVLDAGSATDLGTAAVSLTTGTWYEVEITWTDGGGFTATVYDDGGTSLGSVSTIDATYLSGGVGWGCAAGAPEEQQAFFDFARITTSANIIDDFEDGNVSEYSGGTSSAEVINTSQGSVKHGSYAMELTGTATIYAAAGNLNDDAVAGDTFESWHKLAAGSVVRFLFGVQDGSNYYWVEADVGGSTWTLGKTEAGTASNIAQATGVTVPTGEFLEFEVDWASDGTITATLFDASGTQVSQTSGSDTTWSDGGHGWAEVGSSVTSTHDYAQIAPGGTQTSGTDFIDNFEDNDIDEYLGDTGTASVQTTTVQEGTYALDTASAGTFIYSIAGDGDPDLPNYPAQGDLFEARQYLGSSDVGQFAWGLQDASNYYYADTDPGAGTFQLRMVDGGTDSLLVEATGLTIPTGEWLRIEIEWMTDGTMIGKLFDASGTEITSSGIETTDDTWTSGGVGFGE